MMFFFEVVKSLPRFTFKGSFKNWIYTIAKRQLNTWLRRRYQLPQQQLLANIEDNADWIDPKLQSKKVILLETLLVKIKNQEQLVLRLRYLQNLSVRETAENLSISESNVKVIAHRAIKKLQLLCNPPDTISTEEQL